VLIHPGSRWLFKCLPAVPTAALLDRLAGMGLPLVMTGAPDPAEAPLVKAIKSALASPIVDLTGQLTLPELSALIASARLFIGCDTAPMHLASAAGTPVVAWFGPSDDRVWGPWRVPHRVVASFTHPCRPCHNNGCGGSNRSDCLLTLPQDLLSAAVSSLLDETGTSAPQ
jgi:heptosyltransferase-3